MNCRQTRDLVSAYLDQELTGQQMLEIRAHLSVCDACAAEWRATRDVRRLLRSLAQPTPDTAAQRQLVARLDREARLETGPSLWAAALRLWLPAKRVAHSAPAAPRSFFFPQPRGRRLASALALSSVTVLAVANALAPPIGDAARQGAMPTASQAAPVSASLVTLPVTWNGAPLSLLHFLSVPAAPSAARPLPPPLTSEYTQSAVQAMNTEPFPDEAVSGYVQGATLADYQAPAAGAR